MISDVVAAITLLSLHQRNTYARICCSLTIVQHSMRIVPCKLAIKLTGLNTALCDWILNFLAVRCQAVWRGSTTFSTLALNTSCALSLLLCFLFVHDCMTIHRSSTIINTLLTAQMLSA